MSSTAGDHPHSHNHHLIVEANKDYFNSVSEDYESDPRNVRLATRAAEAILQSYTFNKSETIAMDYACGPGVVSQRILPFAKSVLGVDISQGVVDKFNGRFANEEHASAVCTELKGEQGELSDARFNVIFCSLAYHHFPSIADVTRTLSHVPGGVLIIVDIVRKAEGYELLGRHKDIVAHHHGLGKEDIQQALETGGLVLKKFEDVPRKPDDVEELFVAVGEKPSA